ncbi:homoserine O-acetyltransferase [Trametes punicea]|nr:homoserine O-acetyltransferase [Trametes punicea]
MSIYTRLLDQNILHVPSFTLESGSVLKEVPIAYKTWGQLNERKDNVMIICHAFTGSSDVEDWWGPLMGRGKAFDPNRYLIFCANVLGSPYGSASPVTVNPDTGKAYGPEFPLTTIRDDVRVHKLVLDHLGVNSVAVVIGGSMGGMAVLEWPLCTPQATWGEAQRQSIYSDPSYQDGYYTSQPASGLAAARMAALLTYRSRDSFERRFGRKPQKPPSDVLTPPRSPALPSAEDPLAAHNDGLRNSQSRPVTPGFSTERTASSPRQPIFSAQSYLRYQGDKFTSRFDANCYIHITRKLDTHDVARGRLLLPDEDENAALARVLSTEPPRALVIGIESDGLFTPSEQRFIAEHIPEAELVMIPSPEGHDGFLLEFELINKHILVYLRREFPEYYRTETGEEVVETPVEDFSIKKTSLFGEAEADITRW